MKAKNFKLFIGYHGNGATVCNSAATENGDYKKIAHISESGNIKYYVSNDYIPQEAMQKIQNTAAEHEKKTRERLKRELVTEYGYTRTLDEICNYTPYKIWNDLLQNLKKCKNREEKNNLVTACYIANF